MRKKEKLTAIPTPRQASVAAKVRDNAKARPHEEGPDLNHIAPQLRSLAVRTGDLAFLPGNPMEHDETSVATMQEILRKRGQLAPIIVNRKPNPPVVVSGNKRLQAALLENFEWIAALDVHLDPDDEAALAVEMNATQDQTWNRDLLQKAMQRIGSLNLGERRDAMMTRLAEAQKLIPRMGGADPADEGPDAQVERADELLAKWKVQSGDLWVIESKSAPGKAHRLLCGTTPEGIATVMGDDQADALITDPPYSSGGMFRSDRSRSTTDKYVQSGQVEKRAEFSGDNRDQRSFLTWCGQWMGAAREVATPGAVVACFIDWRQLPTVTDAVQCAGWIWRGLAVWWKPGIRMQRGSFSHSAEFVVHGTNGPSPRDWDGAQQNVFSCGTEEDKEHLAQKPVDVMRWIASVTKPSGIILEPFAGAGSTMVAAEQTERICRAIEIEPKYCAVILERLSQMGLSPRRTEAP